MPLTAPPEGFTWTPSEVKKLRNHFGESQRQLGVLVGVRQQVVSSWETGAEKPIGASVTILTLLALKTDYFGNTESGKR